MKYHYDAKLIRVLDGDTFDFNIDLGFHIFTRIRVRLLDYNAPEVRGANKLKGFEVKDYVIGMFDNASRVSIETHKTGKYGRWLANVKINGRDLKAALTKKFG